MPTPRQLEITAAVVILILLLLLLFIIFRQPEGSEDTPMPEVVVDTLPKLDPADVPAPGVVSASTVARIFVERFGSYSSETDFANVDDVKALATPSYQAELESLVNGYRRQFDDTAGYSGVSTRVISLKIVSESETASTFKLTTQREEAVGTPGNTTLRYQDVEVSLVKTGDDWLINDLTWL